MKSSVQIIIYLCFVLVTGIVVWTINMMAPVFMLPISFGSYSLATHLLLWNEFIWVGFLSIIVFINLLKWESITCWIISATLCTIIFHCYHNTITLQVEDIMWSHSPQSAWVATRNIVFFQVLLSLSYICFHYLLLPFHGLTERMDRFFRHNIPRIISKKYRRFILFLEKKIMYIKSRKYLSFFIYELLTFFFVLTLWIFGFSPILLLAMIAINYEFEIVIIGHIILLSTATIYFASHILKMDRWYIWGFSLLPCIIVGCLINIIDIEIFMTKYGLDILFGGTLVISQIVLISTYCFISCFIPKKKKNA